MKTIKEELRDWLRPVSQLTAFAKSVRNEGGVADDPSKAAKGEYIDPLADFDFDELPPDQKAALLKLQTDHRAQYDEKIQTEQRRLKAEEFARKQQSRADQLEALVRRHNLGGDGPTGGTPVSADAKRMQDLQAKLEHDGLKPEAAAAYAKMLSTAGDLERQRIYAELAPLMGEVGALKANQVLLAASQKYSQVFGIPELASQIQQNIDLLVQKGDAVTDKTVDHLVSMAWGQYVLANPDALKKGNDVNQQQHQQRVPVLGGGGVTSGGYRHDPSQRTDGQPPVTQAETLVVMGNINKFFEADLPKGNGKGNKK